jgi:ArsR family transcriptional regulator
MIYNINVVINTNHADYVLTFKAMADETRLKIVEMLATGELCACKILEHFEITQPTLSYHMKILCDSGLVTGRREGAWMWYGINKEALNAVLNLLNELNQSNQNPQICKCN